MCRDGIAPYWPACLDRTDADVVVIGELQAVEHQARTSMATVTWASWW
jgi:hypothetical protein